MQNPIFCFCLELRAAPNRSWSLQQLQKLRWESSQADNTARPNQPKTKHNTTKQRNHTKHNAKNQFASVHSISHKWKGHSLHMANPSVQFPAPLFLPLFYSTRNTTLFKRQCHLPAYKFPFFWGTQSAQSMHFCERLLLHSHQSLLQSASNNYCFQTSKLNQTLQKIQTLPIESIQTEEIQFFQPVSLKFADPKARPAEETNQLFFTSKLWSDLTGEPNTSQIKAIQSQGAGCEKQDKIKTENPNSRGDLQYKPTAPKTKPSIKNKVQNIKRKHHLEPLSGVLGTSGGTFKFQTLTSKYRVTILKFLNLYVRPVSEYGICWPWYGSIGLQNCT